MNQLDSMRALLSVVDQGGFAPAAQALNTSRAKITRLIQELEAALNIRLLQRTTRTLSLTEAGEVYVARIRPLIEGLDAANDEASSSGRMPGGLLKVQSSLDFAAAQLIPRVPRLQRVYPQLEIEVNTSDKLLEAPDLKSDVTVLFSRQGLADGDYTAFKLGTTHALLCASPRYLEAHPAPVHPSELEQHECLFPKGKGLAEVLRFRSTAAGAQPSVDVRPGPARFHSHSPEALYMAALQGMGIIGMLSAHAQPYLQSGALVRVLPDWVGESWQVWLAFTGRKHVPRKVQAFLAFLRSEFGDPDADPWQVA
ncbi:LysR family transcriptional regulator [Curvibacter gracilis]|uniref:LysR family transcriptional regulator n=1 Tax=Curvibacter gracilis TaxID=230310 RepID=UPI0004AF9AFA|nr:LysR family transcriptional regulator [Curvibacter gracilis]